MTLSTVARGIAVAGAAFVLLATTFHAAVAGEKLVGTYGEERALLRG